MLALEEQIQELIKSYYVAQVFDSKQAQKILKQLNDLRLATVLDAEMRRIYYDQVAVEAQNTLGQQDIFFSRNDIDWTIKAGIADLEIDTTIALEKQSGTHIVITRDRTQWQQIFNAIQGSLRGSEILYPFPEELRFGENEALNINLQATPVASVGQLWFHGCTLKEKLDINVDDIKEEIDSTLPQTQLVPLIYTFPLAVLDTPAQNLSGGEEIFSSKNQRSVLLTHVSVSDQNFKLSLYDEGKNLQISDAVDCMGIASQQNNRFQNYYPLPYPHLLRKGDRLKIRATNGTDTSAGVFVPADEAQYLTFKGFTI